MAKDISAVPKAATASVVVTIVRNQYDPVFVQNEYNVQASDTSKTGTVLETLSATDADSTVDLSKNVSHFTYQFQQRVV